MEIKYTVYTLDPEIVRAIKEKQTQLFEGTQKQKNSYENIWELGGDPNNYTDILIHKEIKK